VALPAFAAARLLLTAGPAARAAID